MKYVIAPAAAAAIALSGGAAMAEGHDDQCFDKGSLTYDDCPDNEVPVELEQPMMDDESGFYLGARGGLAFVESEFEYAPGATVEQDYDTGFLISGMVGYKFADVAPGVALRPEIELGYLSADVEDHEINGGPAEPGSSGETGVFFGFANLFLDLEVVERVDVIIGGGVGFGNADFDGHGTAGIPVAMDDSDTGFGYNVGAGLAYDLAEDVAIEGMYRYMSFDVEPTSAVAFEDDADVDAHTVTIGLRFGL